MELQMTETDQGKNKLICDGYRYRVDKMIKSQEISWRCCINDCKARIKTDVKNLALNCPMICR